MELPLSCFLWDFYLYVMVCLCCFFTLFMCTCLDTLRFHHWNWRREDRTQTLQGVGVAFNCSTQCNVMLDLFQVFTQCSISIHTCHLGVTYWLSFKLTCWYCIIFVILAAQLLDSSAVRMIRGVLCQWDAVVFPSKPAEHMSERPLEDCSCPCVCQLCGLIFPLQIDFMLHDKSVRAARLTRCKAIIAVASSECICLRDIYTNRFSHCVFGDLQMHICYLISPPK